MLWSCFTGVTNKLLPHWDLWVLEGTLLQHICQIFCVNADKTWYFVFSVNRFWRIVALEPIVALDPLARAKEHLGLMRAVVNLYFTLLRPLISRFRLTWGTRTGRKIIISSLVIILSHGMIIFAPSDSPRRYNIIGPTFGPSAICLSETWKHIQDLIRSQGLQVQSLAEFRSRHSIWYRVSRFCHMPKAFDFAWRNLAMYVSARAAEVMWLMWFG